MAPAIYHSDYTCARRAEILISPMGTSAVNGKMYIYVISPAAESEKNAVLSLRVRRFLSINTRVQITLLFCGISKFFKR